MYSFPAELSADANELLNNSSLSQPVGYSYDPHFTTPSGVYDNNNLKGYGNVPANNEQHFPSCHPETETKEGTSLENFDLNQEHALLDLCAGFMTHSLPDDERNSDEDTSSEKDSSDEAIGIDEDSSSSDSDVDNDTALKRHGNFMDLHHLYDYFQSISSPRRRNFVVRGVDVHSSSDIKFCRKVRDGREKICTSDTFPSSGVKKVVTEENISAVRAENDIENGQSFLDMILNSEEYLSIQDNLEDSKPYRDYLYKLSLKKNPRRKKNVLFDVLPTLIEESSDDASDDEHSADNENRIGRQELVSQNEHQPVIRKMKRKKRRFESVRNWFFKTFCGCWKSKDPP